MMMITLLTAGQPAIAQAPAAPGAAAPGPPAAAPVPAPETPAPPGPAPLTVPPPTPPPPYLPFPQFPSLRLDEANNQVGLAQQTTRTQKLQARILWIDATANLNRLATSAH